jgi:hypothetical protein
MAALRSSWEWIDMILAAISRTLVCGTFEKTLRQKMDCAVPPERLRVVLGERFHEIPAADRDETLHVSQSAAPMISP